MSSTSSWFIISYTWSTVVMFIQSVILGLTNLKHTYHFLNSLKLYKVISFFPLYGQESNQSSLKCGLYQSHIRK